MSSGQNIHVPLAGIMPGCVHGHQWEQLQMLLTVLGVAKKGRDISGEAFGEAVVYDACHSLRYIRLQ